MIAFDIETIPNAAVVRDALGLEGTDIEVVREFARRRLEETSGRSEYPALPWHRVVTVCVTIIDPASGRVEVRSLGGELMDERSYVQGFFDFVGSFPTRPRLVSWNGGGFDIPVMRYRAMALGVPAVAFYRDNDYLNRYHELHVDLMDVLSGYGASSRAGLEAVAASMGIPAKRFLERSIIEHTLDGDAAALESYCKLDTVTTMLVFLAWAFHVGRLSRPELDGYTAALRAELSHQSDSRWHEISSVLENWPRW